MSESTNATPPTAAPISPAQKIAATTVIYLQALRQSPGPSEAEYQAISDLIIHLESIR